MVNQILILLIIMINYSVLLTISSTIIPRYSAFRHFSVLKLFIRISTFSIVSLCSAIKQSDLPIKVIVIKTIDNNNFIFSYENYTRIKTKSVLARVEVYDICSVVKFKYVIVLRMCLICPLCSNSVLLPQCWTIPLSRV